MIVEFSVKNFRSIKDLQTISFRATKLDSHQEKHPDVDKNNVVEVGGMRLLKTVGIYGANASGKSNVIKAFELFCLAIATDPTPDGKMLSLLYQPFLLQELPYKSEVFFQIVIQIEEKKYRYGFTISKGDSDNLLSQSHIVSNEWLYGTKDKNQGKYFVRRGIEVDKKSLPNAENIPPMPHPHAFFLKHVASFDKGILYQIWSFFKTVFSLNYPEAVRSISIGLIETNKGKKDLLRFLSQFDLNYDDIHNTQVESEKRNGIVGREYIWLRKDSGQMNLERHESEGTKKLFDLAGHLLSVFNANQLPGQPQVTLIFDEIDSNFHPALVIKLIKMFNDPEINKSNAQLLFTSHDTNLLNPAIMRRDQFYFTEKDEQDATRLYSLADLKGIRNDADFARQYLAGYYGAVPMLKDFKNEPIAEDA